MARCLRCGAGNEWIEGRVAKDAKTNLAKPDGVAIVSGRADQDEASEDIRFNRIQARYGKTHYIKKIPGTVCDLYTLKDNQSVCFGDGQTYYFRLTERANKK